MTEHSKSKSTGGFYQADVSPCSHLSHMNLPNPDPNHPTSSLPRKVPPNLMPGSPKRFVEGLLGDSPLVLEVLRRPWRNLLSNFPCNQYRRPPTGSSPPSRSSRASRGSSPSTSLRCLIGQRDHSYLTSVIHLTTSPFCSLTLVTR